MTTISNLQKIAKIIWPNIDIEKIWLSPANFVEGIRLTNVNVAVFHENERIRSKEE